MTISTPREALEAASNAALSIRYGMLQDADDIESEAWDDGFAEACDQCAAAIRAIPVAEPTPDPPTARLVEALREIEVIEAIYTLGPDHNLERARDIARAALAAAEGRG